MLSIAPLVRLIVLSVHTVSYLRASLVIDEIADDQLKITAEGIIRSIETVMDTSVINYLRSMTENQLSMTRYTYKEYKKGRLTIAKSVNPGISGALLPAKALRLFLKSESNPSYKKPPADEAEWYKKASARGIDYSRFK